MSLPNLSNLFSKDGIPDTGCGSEHRDKRHKPEGRVKLSVSDKSELLVGGRGVFHSGCISVVEMVIAKVTCDAFMESTRPGAPPFYEVFRKPYLKNIRPFSDLLAYVAEEVERLHASGSTNPDIAKIKTVLDLTDHAAGPAGITEERIGMYKEFLWSYISERDISKKDLLSADPFAQDDSEESDGECEYTGPMNSGLGSGIDNIMREYFERDFKYAWSRNWDYPLRAYATNLAGNPVCVGIVMISNTKREEFPMKNSQEKMTIRMQGIVGCPIYRTFNHAPIGNTVLAHVQKLAALEDKIIMVKPIGNPQWTKKLRNAENVILGEAVRS